MQYSCSGQLSPSVSFLSYPPTMPYTEIYTSPYQKCMSTEDKVRTKSSPQTFQMSKVIPAYMSVNRVISGNKRSARRQWTFQERVGSLSHPTRRKKESPLIMFSRSLFFLS